MRSSLQPTPRLSCPAPATSAAERTALLALITVALAALLLYSFLRIDRSLWLDEAFSVHVASRDFPGIIAELRNDNGPPLYYLLLAGWVRAFGITETAVRSLSSTFYILAPVSIYLLGRSLFGRRASLLGAILYMTSPLAVRWAQNARMYSLLGLLALLSTLFFLRFLFLGGGGGDPGISQQRA